MYANERTASEGPLATGKGLLQDYWPDPKGSPAPHTSVAGEKGLLVQDKGHTELQVIGTSLGGLFQSKDCRDEACRHASQAIWLCKIPLLEGQKRQLWNPLLRLVHMKESVMKDRMNTTELIHHIALQGDLSKAAASRALSAFADAVTSTLQKGESVKILGLGTFTVTSRNARTGRNPSTGEVMQISASRHPRFMAGKSLKDELN